MRINLKTKEDKIFFLSSQGKKANFFLKKSPHLPKNFNFISLNKNYYKKGFTLLELLMAVGILAIAALAVAHALTVVSANRAFSYHMGVASNLAQDKLEEIKRLAYGDVLGGSEPGIDETGNSTAGGIYNRTWGFDGNWPINGTKTINVTVSWPPAGSSTHTVTLSTIKGQ